jgi:hypothetical protein
MSSGDGTTAVPRSPRLVCRVFATARDACDPRDTLGFEVRSDVAYGGMRRITVGPADRPARRFPGFPFVFKLDETHRVDCDPRLQE